MNMGVCSDEISWMDEHYYLPHEVNRNYEKDSFFEKETIWISGGTLGWEFNLLWHEEYMLKMCKIRKSRPQCEKRGTKAAFIRVQDLSRRGSSILLQAWFPLSSPGQRNGRGDPPRPDGGSPSSRTPTC